MGRDVERDRYLDDEDEYGILGVVGRGIGTLEDASLIGSSDRHSDSGPLLKSVDPDVLGQ